MTSPAKEPTTNDAMVWTCRLALAVAAQDGAAIKAIVDEVQAAPGGPPLLLTTMAGTIAAMMAESTGSNWREAMEKTIVAVQES